MKKLIVISLVMIFSLTLVSCRRNQAPAEPTPRPTQGPTPTPAETQLPEGERPIVEMTPDAKVQKVSLKITNLPDDVKDVDYELTYFSAGIEKGSIGTYYVNRARNEITLGSCSSGVCNYDQDITHGTLQITYVTNGQKILLRYPFTPGN